ncbi:MAG TPA: isochorismatase family protein [Chthoniobacterales bacterium]
MSELTLDRQTSALVLIDLQKGIVGSPGMAPRSGEEVVRNASRLLEKFRERKSFTVLVHVKSLGDGRDMLAPAADARMVLKPSELPDDWAEFVSEISPRAGDLVISKRQWGAFYGTELDLQLRRRGVRTIVLAGIATNYGVESTARAAYERGYEQIFVEDAMTTQNAEAHRLALEHVFKRMGRIVETEAVLIVLAA